MTSRADLALGHLVLTDEQPPAAADAAALRLVERAQAGDSGAFGSLVSRYQKKVVTTAWRYLRDREDALDAAQETFLRAHKYLGSYDRRECDFGAWLYRITVNVSRDLATRRGRHAAGRSDAAGTEIADGAADPEASAASRAAGRLLDRALDTLTEKERAAFVMRDLDGKPTEDVARVFGSSTTTVRVHICMARKKIRRVFQEAGLAFGISEEGT